MKGKYWNEVENKPEKQLEDFLNEKIKSVKERIKEGTGLDIEPIYYSAGYKDNDTKQKPYNLSKLLYLIVKNTPNNTPKIVETAINLKIPKLIFFKSP